MARESKVWQRTEPERAVLVKLVTTARQDGHVVTDEEAKASLDELAALADTAGAVVVERVVQRRGEIHPATYIGKGKVRELAQICAMTGADLIIFDHELSPAQVRNVENETQARVIDRTELILDIFARRARTRQAKLQVELAQLRYELPRLRHLWTHLERQRGGIGLRGPGEQQLEADRRRAQQRIRALEEELKRIAQRKEQQMRGRVMMTTIALVGYTNVGKSALMNALTGAAVFTENRLFATLDATTRVLRLPDGHEVLLTDTVGFIKNLPHHLVASFHATLEEVRAADLLLHVVDVTHPDAAQQMKAVNGVLKELNCHEKPQLLVLNKCDLLPAPLPPEEIRRTFGEGILTSALTGQGLSDLRERMMLLVRQWQVPVEVEIPVTDGRTLGEIGRHGTIVRQQVEGDRLRVRALLDRRFAPRVAPLQVAKKIDEK
ncbi:MAG: GTPase HflX [Abditibacteriales bacterium]|nr:GTPase HflX [Abditibacteriales bacterium]MDW8366066.1 GTPase HflX [Abditibacteriales bacterium]